MNGFMEELKSYRWLASLLITVMLVRLVGCGGGSRSDNTVGTATSYPQIVKMSVEELNEIALLPKDWEKADFILLEDGRARIADGTITTDVASLFHKMESGHSRAGSYHILKTDFLIPVKNFTTGVGLHTGWLWGYNAYDIGQDGHGHTFQIDDTGKTKTGPHWNFVIYTNYNDMYQDQYVEEKNRRSLVTVHYGNDGCWFYSISAYSSSNPDSRRRIWISGKGDFACNDPSSQGLKDEISKALSDALIVIGITIVAYIVIKVFVTIMIIQLGSASTAVAAGSTGDSNNETPSGGNTPSTPSGDSPPSTPTGGSGGGATGGSSGDSSGGSSDNGEETTNPPPDTTPPFIKSSGIEMLGDGMFKLKVDIGDSMSGPDKDRIE